MVSIYKRKRKLKNVTLSEETYAFTAENMSLKPWFRETVTAEGAKFRILHPVEVVGRQKKKKKLE